MPQRQGWESIQNQLASIHGNQEPKHWGVIQRYSEGGKDPLDGVSAYRSENPPCWHYVSFGFSELYEKRSPNRDESGWGFELSFRLRRESDENEPPLWPVMMLQNLARYVFGSKSPFDDEHYLAWGRPITSLVPTRLEATLFRNDPVLGEIDTPNGRVKFLSAIGITSDEHDLVASQGAAALLPRLLDANPLAVTDINRGSLLNGRH
ncbi:MAG TPA: suppressor of fused domain protein [Candidatus Binataceae bacterium]|nr:suppressor of fused domain protein [Candidatus Binataceae bacterium]